MLKRSKSVLTYVLAASLLAACSGNLSSSGGQPAQSNPSDGSEKPIDSAQPKTPALKVDYGDAPKGNDIKAVNVKQGNVVFDFAYQPDQDEALTLTNVKSGPLLGCDTSNIGLQFHLHRLGSDGKINLAAYDGLGPAPTSVKRGAQYIARVTLSLNKPCLGLSYEFGVRASRPDVSAQSATHITTIIPDDLSWAQVILIDEPNGTGSYEAAQLFELLNVPSVKPNPWQGPAKTVADKNIRITCSAPAIMHPSEEKFGTCEAKLNKNGDPHVLMTEKGARYSQSGQSARSLYTQFVTNGTTFYWRSLDNSVTIQSSPESFQLTIKKQ